jgi:Holliday junction resolvasome RuvABC endonuclease subunit
LRDGKRLASGVWNLKPSRHEGGGMRFVRLRRYLCELLDANAGEVLLGYEEVRRHAGTDAAHIYGGIVAVVQSVCEERTIPYQGVPVGTIKRLATGKGNADKTAMVAAAVVRFWPVTDDNEADALWCAAALDKELVLPPF